MTLSRELWSENVDLVAAALAHPLNGGLADGSLNRATFAGYVAQDAFFLESFARAYALALTRSPDTSRRPPRHSPIPTSCSPPPRRAGWAWCSQR